MAIADRRARQKENLRQEILDAARELFVRDGYDSVSMRKIAEKIEYAPGTLYLYFRDKSEILQSLCDETFAKLRKRMEAIHKDTGDPLDGLRRGLLTYVQFGLDNPSHYTLTFILGLKERAPQAHKESAEGERCFDNLRNIVQRCIQEGRIQSDNAEETAQALWAGVHGVVSLLIMHADFPFVEQSRLVETVVRTLINGISKP